MKSPKYESSPGALAALLATGSFVYADLYTITTQTGAVLLYTTADLAIQISTTRWLPTGPFFDKWDVKATAHWKVGMDVDTWQVMAIPRNIDPITGTPFPDQINGEPWLSAVRAGALDGALFQIDRAYFATWPTPWRRTANPVGTYNIFTGLMADAAVGRTGCALMINSHLVLVSNPMPQNTFQAGCVHTLFDVGCTLSAASFAVTGTATSGSTGGAINATLSQASGYFDGGRVVMTSGASDGFAKSVKTWDGTTLKMLGVFPFGVSSSDTFTVYPGCDKTLGPNGCPKFNNVANFRGFPFIPDPETAT